MMRTIFSKIAAVVKEFLVRVFFLSLFLVVFVTGFLYFWQWRKNTLLSATWEEVVSAVENTREKAQEGDRSLNYGVSFADDNYTIFATTSDWERRMVDRDETHFLTKTLHFANHNLVQDCNGFRNGCVVFMAGSGDVLRINEKQEFNIVIYDDDTNEERLISVY